MSNSLRSNALALFRDGVALALLGVLAMAYASDELAPASQPKPKYAPGILIVKFKEPVADELKGALVRGEPLHQVSLTPSLDALNSQYGLKELRMLFSGFQIKDANGAVTRVETMEEHVEKIRDKFPVRAARAAEGYNGPDLTRVFKVHVDPAADMQAAAADYRADPDVEYAEPDYIGQCLWEPNDHYYNTEEGSWGQDYDDLWGIKRVRCAEAWDWSRGSGTIIAVLDTGIWYRQVYGDPSYLHGHPDIVPNLWVNYYEYYGYPGYDDDGNGKLDDKWGWNFAYDNSDPLDDHGHGTYIAGIAGAVGDNEIGMIGLAPEARIMNLKVIDSAGQVEYSEAAEAIKYAADNGADVLNCSWGDWGKPQVVLEAVEYACWYQGCVVVAAAGNSNFRTYTHYPARFKWSITTAATGYDDLKASYSNWGFAIDVAAPGGDDHDILSLRAYTLGDPGLVVDDLYYRENGTSPAAPHVAAAAALILSYRPNLNPEEVRQCIRKAAVDLGESGFDRYYGHGRLDAKAALDYAIGGHTCPALLLRPEVYQFFRREQDDCVEIYGIADGDYFQSWETHWAVDERPWEWVEVASGTDKRYWYYGGEMGTIDISDFPEEKLNYVLRLTVYGYYGEPYYDYTSFRVYPWK